MNYLIKKPTFHLAPFVKFYWMMEINIPASVKHIQRIVPNGLMELMFYSGKVPIALNDSKMFEGNLIISGLQKSYYDLEVTGSLTIFSVVFEPHALTAFFNLPATETFNQNIALRHLAKDHAEQLEDELMEALSFEDKIQIIEKFLRAQLVRAGKDYERKRITGALQNINFKRGIVHIDELASYTCLSRKQFERQFSFYIGTSPKQFLKTIRFQYAVNQKAIHNELSLTELTYRCGYYDQAHMSNDFAKLTGLSPRKYFSDCEPHSDYFQ